MRCVYACLILSFAVSTPAFAQPNTSRRSVSANEYIESTSPLRGGGTVTSRSQPGKNVQTVTSIANLPVVGGTASAANRNATTAPVYSYPGTAPVARTAAAQLQTQPQAFARQPTAYQVPTLGLTPIARTAQNCNCAPAPPQVYQPQAYQPQTYARPIAQQNFAPAASQAPSLGVPNLNVQVPGQTGFAQPGFQGSGFQSGTQTYTPNYALQSGIGTPQFGAGGYGNGGSWFTPFVTGRGQYSPLLNFRNLPPGTHLGQGIIGQPTAYVDGQVLRNLLRYVSP